ncbi:MAG: helix-turn-helix transcriptional regulator [Selenomonadales bacterium]|nr:helix-turn-helix transcriptional regulator [Selenomonadales bacterium]
MKIDKMKLDLLMADKMYSLKELSKQSGVSQVTVIQITRGRREARPETVGKIARALDVRVVDIIERGWGDAIKEDIYSTKKNDPNRNGGANHGGIRDK